MALKADIPLWSLWRERRQQSALRRPPPVLLERGSLPWLLAVALATTLPHAAHLPLWLSLFCGMFLAWRGALWWRNGRLPKPWWLAILVLVGVAGIGAQYRGLLGRDPGVALLVFFMAAKPMEMRTRRDALVLVMLGFFLLLTHYLFAQDIPTGLWLLLSATLLTAALIRLHGRAAPPLRLLRQAALLIAQALPFMFIFFLLFPRVQGPLWGLPRDAHAGLTGLSERLSPGSLSELIQSGEIAFRVKFAGRIPDKAQLYWRGPVMMDYDGHSWRASYYSSRRPGEAPEIVPAGERFSYVTTLEPNNQRWLLPLDLPVLLPERAVLVASLETLSRDALRDRARFAFTSVTDYTANAREMPAILRQSLALPGKLNPRSRALASAWKDKLATPERISAAALRFFRQENFYYSLQAPLLGQNAVDEFLFDSRRGFCEHYASAYVFLMRAAGVPARVVTGYQGGEENPVDGYLTVRQSDAHAWAEIWLEGKGWRRIDPTAAIAPSRIEQGIGSALPAGESPPALLRLRIDWLRLLRYRWEAVDNAWNQWIIGYNPRRQQDVLSRLGLSAADWRRLVAFMAAAGGAVFCLMFLWALRRRKRLPPAVRAWRRYCGRLEALGVGRAVWEGPFDFARRVTRERPEFGPLTWRAAESFVVLQYGTGATGALPALRECVRRLPAAWRVGVKNAMKRSSMNPSR